MKRVFAFALLMSALVMAGALYAYATGSGAIKGTGRMTGSQVRATVMSNNKWDTVRLFTPDGNEVLCTGESIPIFRITEGMNSMLPSGDLSGLKLVGEVRVEYLVGDSYAEGSLIAGGAQPGDIAVKPSRACLAPMAPQG